MLWTIHQIRKMLLPFCTKYNIDKVILYGSRARGTNRERSDIDLAIIGEDYVKFKYDVIDNARTLLLFDIVNYAEIGSSLREEIDADGRVLYEKGTECE